MPFAAKSDVNAERLCGRSDVREHHGVGERHTSENVESTCPVLQLGLSLATHP